MPAWMKNFETEREQLFRESEGAPTLASKLQCCDAKSSLSEEMTIRVRMEPVHSGEGDVVSGWKDIEERAGGQRFKLPVCHQRARQLHLRK